MNTITLEAVLENMVDCPSIQKREETMTKTDIPKNFKVDYSTYETLEEARKDAQRKTARGFDSNSIWQRIEETVVPAIDIQINPVEVTTVPVA